MAKKLKYWIADCYDYGDAIEWTLTYVGNYLTNYNFIAIGLAFTLFEKACPNTYSKLRSARYFDNDTKNEESLVPRWFMKSIEKEWNCTVFPSIIDVSENKLNRKWNDFLTPFEKVCENYVHRRASFEEWLTDKSWNCISMVCKYGTQAQKKEYWNMMVTLKERIEIIRKFMDRVEKILEEKGR
ncbi:MAG: hypothetical protein K6E51_02795 [Treponema sp.]|nr:hypothetical protein [Treponema sp.]